MYKYIADIEMEIFRRYKVLIHGDECSMTMLDLQSFVQKLNTENKIEEKSKRNDGNTMIKSLYAIGDIINFMRYKDTKPR